MSKIHTIRSLYLYMFCGSALLSAGLLLAMRGLFAMLYSRYTPDSAALFVRFTHWIMNHIGARPAAVMMFTAVCAGLFLLRSQKAANDTTALLRAAEQLAARGSCELADLEVQSGGEFGRLAASLRRIQQAGLRPAAASAIQIPAPDPQESMALILRTRTLIRMLGQAEAESGEAGCSIPGAVLQQLEIARLEAQGLEKTLERWIRQV
ncbi:MULTISPECIES: hypothetical protein [unclassified Paenibacillus]|uniref:hypothetical protein n=1 Tax=unclassified Paenibacillus TaxID=185978 RepID=UPI0004F87E73|nr:hypothetical protein [Paenibacillus sp. FSL P4-0081]AIQ32619.1 hypothetical protein P40081_34390 [Paenibacillus sp. FSL P4-0081]